MGKWINGRKNEEVKREKNLIAQREKKRKIGSEYHERR